MAKKYKLYRVAQSGIAVALTFTMALSNGCSAEKKNSSAASQIVTEHHLEANCDVQDVTMDKYETILDDITKIYDKHFKNVENLDGENDIVIEATPNDETKDLDSYNLRIKINNVTNGSVMQKVLEEKLQTPAKISPKLSIYLAFILSPIMPLISCPTA